MKLPYHNIMRLVFPTLILTVVRIRESKIHGLPSFSSIPLHKILAQRSTTSPLLDPNKIVGILRYRIHSTYQVIMYHSKSN